MARLSAFAAVAVAATLILSPVAATAAPATFTSLQEGWDAIKVARSEVKTAEAELERAKAAAVQAGENVTATETEVTNLEADLVVAETATDHRERAVGVIAKEMYVSGGAVPGNGLEWLSLPAGVDIPSVVSSQVWLAAGSKQILDRAEDAAAQEQLMRAKVEAARLRVEEAKQAAITANQQVEEAEKAVVAARLEVAKVEQAVDDYIASIPVPSGSIDCTNPSSDAIAATIYSQAIGLGLGEVAAIVGIGVGLGETNLSNDTDGDCWYGSCSNGRTSSRGVFQQFWSWVPPGMEWSGQDGPTGGVGTPYDQFNGSNAWGPGGWAVSDPRMDPAQAANMFFLGPDYGASMGLEDNSMYQALRSSDPLDLSSSQMVTIAQQVQGFPERHMGSYEQNMTRAVDYFMRIKAGKVPVPAFRAPLEGMYKSATTTVTRNALKGVKPTTTVDNEDKKLSIPNDGVLLVGDSLMEGVATMGGVPEVAFGGPVRAFHEIGIGTAAAVDRWERNIANGPSRVLVSLGSNDSARSAADYATQIDRVMKAAGPKRQVYWYTLHYRPVNALNAVLERKATQYPNLTLVETRDLLAPSSGYTSPVDNYLHPNGAGYEEMWKQAFNADRALSGYCPAWATA